MKPCIIAASNLDILVFTDIGMEPFTYALAFSQFLVQCVFWGHPTTWRSSHMPSTITTSWTPPKRRPRRVFECSEPVARPVRLVALGAFYFSNESGQYRPSRNRARACGR